MTCQPAGTSPLEREEYIKAVKRIAAGFRNETWQNAQDRMLRAFVRKQCKWARNYFDEDDLVGSEQDIIRAGRDFQVEWASEKNENMSGVFW